MSGHRTTQLRATFPLGGDHMRVMWVVTEPAPLVDLVEDVQTELANLLVDNHLAVTDVHWIALYGSDGAWLRADLTVKPWTDPRRDRLRRATTEAN